MRSLENIKRIRRNLNLTQKQLSSIAEVSQSLIAKIESGKIEPSYSKAIKIFSSLENFQKKESLKARHIMTKKIFCLSPDDSIKKAARIMSKNEISQLPVMKDKKITGLITESAILRNPNSNKIKDIIEDAPPIISINTPISTISHLILIHPMLIVQDRGKIKGVITKSDIIRKKFNQKQ